MTVAKQCLSYKHRAPSARLHGHSQQQWLYTSASVVALAATQKCRTWFNYKMRFSNRWKIYVFRLLHWCVLFHCRLVLLGGASRTNVGEYLYLYVCIFVCACMCLSSIYSCRVYTLRSKHVQSVEKAKPLNDIQAMVGPPTPAFDINFVTALQQQHSTAV